jgi:K+-sensing histidine kinase KdpD
VQARTRDLTEALDQQKATGEILAAISGSITDAKPVFDTIVRNILHLLGTQRAVVQVLKNGMVHLAAAADDLEFETHAAHYPQPLDENSGGGRAMISKQVVQFAPVVDNPSAPPVAQTLARSLGFNSMIMAPMIRGDTVIGAIGTFRTEPKAFDDRQVALIKTFADQAVIAIENARLFEEISQKSRDLEIASQHKSQFVANMSHELRTPLAAILGYAELMQEGFYEPQGPKSLDALTRIRSNGKHLLGLINTVLDIAKIESGQFSLNLAEYALASVVETVRAATCWAPTDRARRRAAPHAGATQPGRQCHQVHGHWRGASHCQRKRRPLCCQRVRQAFLPTSRRASSSSSTRWIAPTPRLKAGRDLASPSLSRS